MTSSFIERLCQRQPTVLSALGDSLTVGYMVHQGYLDLVRSDLEQRYPEADLQVLNHGVCGDTVFDGAKRLHPAILAPRPHLALVQFGLNDCFSGISPARFSEGLNDVILWIKSSLPDSLIMLIPPPPVEPAAFDIQAEPFRVAMVEAAASRATLIAPVSAHWGVNFPGKRLWLSDGIHPTEAGYRCMAEAIIYAL
jgi:acyl-CoA thioesterase I